MHLQKFQHDVYPVKDKLYRFARWLLKNNEDAEDIVQEVLLKLWSKRKELDHYNSIEALAMRITKNLCLNKLKSKKNVVDINQSIIETNTASPLHRTEYNNIMEIMELIINQLPTQQRMVIQLKSIEGYSIKEISDIMETTDNNIRVVLCRARNTIKETYRKQFDDNTD